MKFEIGQDVVLPDGSVGKVDGIYTVLEVYEINGKKYKESEIFPYQFKEGDRVEVITAKNKVITIDCIDEHKVRFKDTEGRDWVHINNIRLASSEPEKWEPKVGEEVEIGVHDEFVKCIYIGKAPYAFVGYDKNSGEVIWAIACRPIPPDPDAPLRKSIEDCGGDVDKLVELVKNWNDGK